MSVDLAAVLIKHQGPYFLGTHQQCQCGLTVQTAREWSEHLAAELRAASLSEIQQIIADDDARGSMPDFITLDKIREALGVDR